MHKATGYSAKIEKNTGFTQTRLRENSPVVLPISVIIEYEIRSSWFAHLAGSDFLKNLAAKYIVWKTRRKYKNYRYSLIERDSVKNQQQ